MAAARRNQPGEGSKEESVEDNRAELLRSKLIREQGEVSSQQVQEDVTESHVIVGLHYRSNTHTYTPSEMGRPMHRPGL